MFKAAWWNGVLTVLGIFSIGTLLHYIWTHDVDGIFTMSLVTFFFAMLWFISAVTAE
jgi:hypothetical protein